MVAMNQTKSTLLTLLVAIAVMPFASAGQTPAPAAQPAVPAAPQTGAPSAGPPGFGGMGRLPVDAAAAKAPRTLSPYFVPAAAGAKAPDSDGFIQRWLLLEPIAKPIRTNAVFVGTYVKKTFAQEYFPDQFTVVPKDGESETVNGQELKWHALDTTNFDAKLFRFAYGLNKPTYGVIFWAVTVIESPREIDNVRLAVGSNSASMWWLNGQDVANLFDDRRMVMDDVVSKRLTLNKGRNILRGAVINGPGMSDFCVRFIDDSGKPVKETTADVK